MALALGAFALALVGSSASAVTVPHNTTVNQTAGHSSYVKVGTGKLYAINTCTSSAPSTVACRVLPTPQLQIWCLAATNVGATLTVTYLPLLGANPIGPTTITANCKAARVPKIQVLNSKAVTPLTGTTGVLPNSCTTDTLGATCTTRGDTVVEACTLGVTANALPALVTATVTVEGTAPVQGQQVKVYFICK